jgi:lipid-binding SYLF domain-containing protein
MMRCSENSGFDHWSATGIRHLVGAFCLALAVSAVAQGQVGSGLQHSQDGRDGANRSGKAAHVFREIMDMPGKSIPPDLLEDAVCVAVFPSVEFILGGCGGRGVVSCRTAKAWSAPAFFNLGGGSFALQVGARSTDFVMLFMNDDGRNSLMSDQFTLGGDISVAAGPIGGQAGASTDLKFSAQILSYSRSKGLFAGLELEGVVIKLDKDDMRDVYGEGVTAEEVLTNNKVTAPVAVWAFPITLWHYSSRKAVE